MEIKNAIIESVRFDTEKGLSMWITLDYGGTSQVFGGYMLYLPKSWKHHKDPGNYCGHFIYRVMEIAGVNDLRDIVGKTIRVKSDHSKVESIGHIVKNDWFCPSKEFEEIKSWFDSESAPKTADRN